MNLISTTWSCQRCGAAFISTPPDNGLCDDCLRDAPMHLPAARRPRMSARTRCLPAPHAAARSARTAASALMLLVPVASYTQLAHARGGERR